MKTGDSGSFRSIFLLFLIFCLSFTVMTTACGRKGDPFPIIPPEEPLLENVSGTTGGIRKDPSFIPSEHEPALEIINAVQPETPSGLTAIFTGTAIVISWHEETGQEIKYYNIYRSSVDDYTSIGKTDIPVFTDRNIKPDTEYSYRVSVVGESESPLSKEIKVKTVMP